MSNNIFTYTINLRDLMSPTLTRVGKNTDSSGQKVRKLRSDVQQLNKTPLSGLTKSFGGLFSALSPIVIITGSIYKLIGGIKESTALYKDQATAEKQLATVMGNMMDARQEDIDSILALTSAQQKLGVIGDEVQLAGAQELATYLEKRSSLEKIIPVMNDMLAQQYGLNASQEQAVQIASMLGKVMDGQVGALSRYGYKFDEVQENILKTGTEAERAAVLFDVVSSSVGGVNAALAKTPEGKLQQDANDAGDQMERLGSIITTIKSHFASLRTYIRGVTDSILSFFEQNRDKIAVVVATVSNILVAAFEGIGKAVNTVYTAVKTFIDGVNEGNPVFVAVAMVITTLTAALIAYKAYIVITATVTKLWAGAQMLLNGALTISPLGVVVAIIIALIALITFLIVKVDGWGNMWRNTMEGCKLIFEIFTSSIKYGFNTMIDGLMIGLNKIKAGWVKFKMAVGIGNREDNQAMLDQINNDTERRKQEIRDGKQNIVDLGKRAGTAFSQAAQSLSINDTSLSDVAKSLGAKLGISPAGVPGMDNTDTGGFGGIGSASAGTGSSIASSIATGGSKTTHITLNLDSLVREMNINSGNIKEGAEKIRDIVVDELTRALTMTQANV